ncbi:MAG TPA: response regulator transcription factor [Solirubrobacteraceae bacterium]|nr:response regulator transcription factor [Solirubrobacteraceae bacterium]
MINRSPVTVLLAQFEDIVGLGLRVLIDGDSALELVAHDVSHDQLGDALTRLAPRVAVINFGSLASAIELRELHRRFPEVRLLVLANRPDPGECRQLLSFGANACLAKHTEARDVLHAIHLASRGLQVMPAATLGAAAQAPPAGPDLLTPREAEVLHLLQRGRSNAEIALELSVGVETVRTHARRVYRKLGVRTRRELRGATVRAS